MRFTYTPGEEMIRLLTAIAEKKGEIKAYFLDQLEPRSREENKIDSVHATIFLQNREPGREKVAAIVRNLSVRAPRNQIREIKNTMRIYDHLSGYNPFSQDSFKEAYRNLQGIKERKAAYRKEILPFYNARGFLGISPSCKEMREGMNDLFHYLRHGRDPILIKSCLCHYAIQYYQPFEWENEKMSRLWQTLILMKDHPSFEFLPWEKELLTEKKKYYSHLPGQNPENDQSEFVKHMLEILHMALNNLLEGCRKSIRPMDRIRYFHNLGHSNFTRKEYMLVHKNISTATASRDLDLGVETGLFLKRGMNNQTTYQCYLLSE